jgi:hypothetical protein
MRLRSEPWCPVCDAEEMATGTGQRLGDFPQAVTHAALLQTALALHTNEPTRT